MITAINYANDVFKIHQKYNAWTAHYVGKADRVIRYTPEDLDPEFRERAKAILSFGKGGGYWVWKPYVCLKTLQQMKEGDILFYCDSGAYYMRPLTLLKKTLDAEGLDILAFTLSHLEKRFTKKRVFEFFDFDTEKIRESLQILAGYFMVRKNAFTVRFFKEFLSIAELPAIIMDPDTEEEQSDEFFDHRHDQSIFSLLCKKYNIPSFRDPSEWGDYTKNYFRNIRGHPVLGETAVRVLNSPYPRIVESCRNIHPLRHWIDCRLISAGFTKVPYELPSNEVHLFESNLTADANHKKSI